MLLGINMLLWTTHVGEEHLHLCEELKRLGYDGIELPVFSGTPEDYRRLGVQLADIGLRVMALGVLPGPERDIVDRPCGLHRRHCRKEPALDANLRGRAEPAAFIRKHIRSS